MNYKKVVTKFITKARLSHLFEKWGDKTDNPFVKAVGDENLEKYSRFCRSFESRLGNFLEKLAQAIVQENFECLSQKEIKEIKDKDRVKADLCFLKNDVWNVIELKSGGNLDSKKEPAERRNLDKLKLIISKKKKKQAQFYFATAYKSGKGAIVFSEDELLLGENFWEFICDDKDSYNYILKSFHDQIKIYKEENK